MKLGIFIPALTGAVLAGSAAIAQTSQPGTDDRGSIGISGQAAGSGGARIGGSGEELDVGTTGSASGSGNAGPVSGRGSADGDVSGGASAGSGGAKAGGRAGGSLGGSMEK